MAGAPIIMIAVAASRAAVDAIGEALGRGPVSVGVRMTTDPAALEWNSAVSGAWPYEPTHYGGFDDSTEKPMADLWQAISNGDLPADLPDGKEWGVGGVISYADALAAVTPAGKFVVCQCSASVDPAPSFWGFASGNGIYKYPDPPL